MYNLLRILSSEHTIHLVSYIRDESEKAYLSELSFCASVRTIKRGRAWQGSYVLKTCFSQYPFLYETYTAREAYGQIQEVLNTNHIDLIHIEPSYVGLGIPKTTLPVIAVEHNIEHEIYMQFVHKVRFPWLRWLLKFDIKKMIHAEETTWKSVAGVVAVSEDNKSYIERKALGTPVYLVRNGVDLQKFLYQDEKKKQVQPVFLYVGNFAWMENQDAVSYLVSKLWPHILAHYPGATLRIVGKSMSNALSQKIKGTNVKILSDVENIQEELDTATIMLAPIRIGGGTKYKILESMACGLPVVTTTLGSEGIHARHGVHLYCADSLDETLFAIHALLGSTRVYNTIRKQARKLIESRYSWEMIAKDLDFAWKNTR